MPDEIRRRLCLLIGLVPGLTFSYKPILRTFVGIAHDFFKELFLAHIVSTLSCSEVVGLLE